MPQTNHLEIFFAAQDHLNRSAGRERQRGGHALDVHLHLVAEAAANPRRHATNLRHRQAERVADIGLNAKHRLICRPNGDAAGGIDLSQGPTGFDSDMRLRLSLEFVLNDDVALRPSGIDIALGKPAFPGEIATAFGFKMRKLLVLSSCTSGAS